MKEVLIVGYANSYFRVDYVNNMKNKGIVFDVLSFEKCKDENRELYRNVYVCRTGRSKIGALVSCVSFFVNALRLKKYDCIHIHSVKLVESISAFILARKGKSLVCSIYGSDIYRVSFFVRKGLRSLFKHSRYINVGNEDVCNDFNKMFNYEFEKKVKIIPFGNSHFNFIDKRRAKISDIKEELGIPHEKIVLTIGYNATIQQHHHDLFKIIDLMDKEIRNRFYVIVPLSYGNEEYKRKILAEFESYNFKGKCITDFWVLEDVSKLRVISDIMIQVQDTDQFSGSMIEYLYAGNVIVTGSWLPYSKISDYIVTVDNINEIERKLPDIVNKLSDYKQKAESARNYLYDSLSWDKVDKLWLKLYE